MKKILAVGLTAAILSTAAYARFIVGLEYAPVTWTKHKDTRESSNGTSVSYDGDYEYQPVVLKVGFGNPLKLSGYGYYSRGDATVDDLPKDIPFVDSITETWNELGFGMKYGFPIASVEGLAPFVRGGFGLTWSELDNAEGIIYDQDYLFGWNVKVGGGISYLLARHFQFLTGVEYIYRRWQDMEFYYLNSSRSYTHKQKDRGAKLFIGLNFVF